ncbi:hypothetical protein [Butyrivibrio sp. INlla21]|uniref:hypothetical protein n=1 Tax=Butyrivibrio sp. INlla21 TaxID=1520811 RepID=UPI0008EF9D7B|nr:hypothetical protein [Butyrivibrio sp. INlla21]SFU62696.1 hypothetical protein SAMN02910342_01148 [Butyrivibrio sp. INlla21]
MKKRIMIGALTVLLTGTMLVACKPSEEKLNEAETTRQVLIEAKKAAEETFLDITDSSKKSELEALAEREAEIESIDFTKMSDKKIDAVLPDITGLTQEYQSLQSTLNATLSSEKNAKDEAAKHMDLGSYIINKTGLNIIEVKIHDITADTYSDNLLGEGVVLEQGYTLMGAVLDVNVTSSEWEVVIKDENNTSHTLECGDLKSADKEGIALVISLDSATGAGKAEIGSYNDL